MFAVIESGGKQHTVSEGDNLKIESISGEEGSTFDFDKVLMISDGQNSKIGSPYLENAKVTAKFVSHGKYEKINIIKWTCLLNGPLLAAHQEWGSGNH